jgi:signal transduction histidine kinase/CheY-like chemotaxis protein
MAQEEASNNKLLLQIQELEKEIARLKRQNDIFSILLKNLEIGVFMVEAPSGKPILANDAALKLLGRGILPDANKQNLSEVYKAFKAATNSQYPTDEMPIILGMYGKSAHIDDMIVEHPDGTQIILEVQGTPVTDEHGNVWASLVSFTNITERKKAELLIKEKNDEIEAQNEEYRQINEELHFAKKKAEESDKLKTAFLQNMSHEIRTPMNAIMGFSDLLTVNIDNKSKILKYSDIINRRCSDLLDIINDILDIAKIESGQLSLNIEECNINALLNELSVFFIEYQKKIGKENISFQLTPLSDSVIVKTDKVKIKQILINLITNAFKFTSTGYIKGGYKIENKYLEFFISDSGIGIPQDKQNLVFERFTQLDHESRKTISGTGLGLSIVKGLVSLLGGEIKLESEPDKGSTFKFTIPFDDAKEIKHTPTIENRIGFDVFSNKKVLVVEDDKYNADFLKEILMNTDLKVLYADNARTAIDIVLSEHIDLVLMDVCLPDMNGYETVLQIHKTNPNIKIIAQTAYASTEDEQLALKKGCVDYISKPIKSSLLLQKISKALNAGN